MKTAQDYYEQERINGNTLNITSNFDPDYHLEFYQEIFKLMEGFASQHPTLSKESIMEVLKDNWVYDTEQYTDAALNITATEISNLTPAVSDDHNYLQSPGFEHLSNGVQESGTSTDHTILVVSEQPDVSDGDVDQSFWEWFRSDEADGWTNLRIWKAAIKWLQSVKPAKGEECECKDLNATNRICNHCGKIVPIIHYQNPPTPDEKGGEG